MGKYNFGKIEEKWQKIWREKKVYEPDLKKAEKPFYNLMMFPYPSAEGLHVGNMYAFVGSDIYGRFKRMQGYDVFEPIGLDGFGIHSENYALKIGAHPMEQAKISKKRFYKQLEAIGNGFAWDEKLETYDSEYYKWTQWIFVQMFKQGLAYRKKASVNWCPSCKTVLADEQVISDKCERCSAEVIKKELEQWFFKITEYAEKLLKNLNMLDWSERVKIAQRNWIGKSEGALIKFPISLPRRQAGNSQFSIEVFTTRPDTIFGATYLVLAPEHPFVENSKSEIKNWLEAQKYIIQTKNKSETERVSEGKEKIGVELKGVKAINPATKEEIPIWVADYVLGSYGTGAIMAVPAHDERDREFAKKFRLPISNAPLIDMDDAIKKTDGRKTVQYHLRDWLVSRQRYWGAPIPMIYCEKCDWQPVAEKDLPVKLPLVKNFRPTGTGKSPLASVKSFYETKCPKCGGKARRETDVSDTFLDSAWYYLRYPSAKEKKAPWNKEITKKWLPVDMYIGGAEHSVLHLLYVRFLAMALEEADLLNFDEPFKKFRAHGLLIKEGVKMSKSKGNVINPDFYIKEFGADALRMYLMFLAPFEQGGDFRDAGILGTSRFLERMWQLGISEQIPKEFNKLLHQTIKKVTEDIENLHYNTAVSALMILLNKLEETGAVKEQYEIFLKLLAPFAPHLTEELWYILGHKNSIHKEKWPEHDDKLIKETTFELVIQINGKHRGSVLTAKGITQKSAEDLAKQNVNVNKFLQNQKIKKVVFIPNRLINFVLSVK